MADLVIRHKHTGSGASRALFIGIALQPARNTDCCMLCKYSKHAFITNARNTSSAQADKIYALQVNALGPWVCLIVRADSP